MTSVYAPIDTTDPSRAGMPENRFLAAGPVQITDLWPRDSTCQVYLSYTDGLFCLTAQYGVPFAVRPFDRSLDRDHERAQRLAQQALGTRFGSVGRFLFFAELDSLPSGACVSFELRQLSKPSQDADKGDPWASAARAFYAFACQIGDRILYPPSLTSTDSAARQPRSYSEVGGAKVWDLFTFRQQPYLLALYGSCAGECYEFQVLRLDPDSLRSVAKIPLWSM